VDREDEFPPLVGDAIRGATVNLPWGSLQNDAKRVQQMFLKWVDTNKKPRTARGYRNALKHLGRSFGGRRLGQIDELSVERHKRALIEAGHATAASAPPRPIPRTFAIPKPLRRNPAVTSCCRCLDPRERERRQHV